MTRLSRRNRTASDLGIKSSGGMLDIFDNTIKEAYRINDIEFDYICEHITDDEIQILLKGSSPQDNLTFTDKRNKIILINKYLKLMKDGSNINKN